MLMFSRFTESLPQANFFQTNPVTPTILDRIGGAAGRRKRIEKDLAKAIDNQEMRLDYQPQWDRLGEKLVGVEALIRWQHPELGNVSPNEFIPVAEQTGRIVSLGQWVLEEACRQYQAWQKQGLPHFLLGVNLSLQQLQSPNFVGKVQQILQRTAMDPRQLQLEVTEGLIFQDLKHTVAMLKRLQKIGVRLAIDDFGTGYSSLSVLKDLPVHTLKIDKSFLDDLEAPKKAEVILESIIKLGQRLQLSVVAEGVETEAQMELLQSLQCDVLQGFFFSHPLGVEEITHYLHHSSGFSPSNQAIAA